MPYCAPAIEYVAMPDGSSSAAPVTSPGPSAEKKRRGHRLRVVLLPFVLAYLWPESWPGGGAGRVGIDGADREGGAGR